MAKERRLSLRAALALAAVIREQEQAEALAGLCFDEQWAPFGDEEAQPAPMFSDEDEEGEQPGAVVEGSDPHTSEIYRDHFGSVQEFCEAPFKIRDNERVFKDEQLDSIGQHRKDGGAKAEEWFGARSAKEAMDRATHGWPEGAERVRKMMEQIDAPPPVDVRRRAQRADQGDELDIHAVYRGGLDRAWTRRRRQHSRARLTVRVVARIDGSHAVNAEGLFWRGAAVLRLVELLEEGGYRVEVLGGQFFGSVDTDEKSMLTTFVVKEAGAPLDMEQTAGALCNAGFFRTHGFRAMYALAGHKLREGVLEKRPVKDERGQFVRLPGGKLVERDVLTSVTMRTGVSWENIVTVGALDADGTKTFTVPQFAVNREKAAQWVAECLKSLESHDEVAAVA